MDRMLSHRVYLDPNSQLAFQVTACTRALEVGLPHRTHPKTK